MIKLLKMCAALASTLCVLVLMMCGTVVYVQSNWSALPEERITTDLSVWNENISTALAHVNAHQSLIMNAALTCNVDARALGAGILARRLLNVQPLVQDYKEIAGTAHHIGFAQVSVQSTEAVLRVIFAPNADDKLTYYPHSVEDFLRMNSASTLALSTQEPPSNKQSRHFYAEAQRTLTPFRTATREQVRTALQHDDSFSILIAAVQMKQAQTRFINERNNAEADLRRNGVKTEPVAPSTPLAYFAEETEDVRYLAPFLYQRGDVLP